MPRTPGLRKLWVMPAGSSVRCQRLLDLRQDRARARASSAGCTARRRDHFIGAKIAFQSFFMLITVQPCLFASDISESLNVPTFDFGP